MDAGDYFFDPYNPLTWGRRNTTSSSESSQEDDEYRTTYELRVGDYVFDLELHTIDETLCRLMLARMHRHGITADATGTDYSHTPTLPHSHTFTIPINRAEKALCHSKG